MPGAFRRKRVARYVLVLNLSVPVAWIATLPQHDLEPAEQVLQSFAADELRFRIESESA
jgi:hypothetical protein